MKNIIFILLLSLAQPIFSQVLTSEEKEFCISRLSNYLNVKEEVIKEKVEIMKSFNPTEEDIAWFKNNIIRIDSVITASIDFVKEDDCINMVNLLDKERYNIYAHPHNDTYQCYDFHSVMALIYSKIIEDDREYYTILADFGEFSKMQIETVQSNWEKPHPLYLQVLKELKQIYELLGNQTKINEMLLLILKAERNS